MFAGYAIAQETLSLAQCLQMGIDRNLSLKTYEGNILKGKHNISENRARLLPQINIGAGLNDNFTPPVSVTDGSAYGKPYNVTKTLQYNSSASVQLQMPLYNQTALTAVDIAKTLAQLNTFSYGKAKEDLIMEKIMKTNNTAALAGLVSRSLLDPTHIDEYIRICAQEGNTELTALLLQARGSAVRAEEEFAL